MPPCTGCPPKKKRNITGLRNQTSPSAIAALTPPDGCDSSPDGSVEHDQEKRDAKDTASSEWEDGGDSDFESDGEWVGLMDKKFGQRLAALAYKEDQTDIDWIPYQLRQKTKIKKGSEINTSWAVRKQKQHRQVSQRAMMSIEAVLNTS